MKPTALALSAGEETARVKRAIRFELGKTKDEVLDTVFRAVAGSRRAGLPSGLPSRALSPSIGWSPPSAQGASARPDWPWPSPRTSAADSTYACVCATSRIVAFVRVTSATWSERTA